jgi:hypothetical protein
LTELRMLNLMRTRVTAEGVNNLQQALPDCQIKYSGAANK